MGISIFTELRTNDTKKEEIIVHRKNGEMKFNQIYPNRLFSFQSNDLFARFGCAHTPHFVIINCHCYWIHSRWLSSCFLACATRTNVTQIMSIFWNFELGQRQIIITLFVWNFFVLPLFRSLSLLRCALCLVLTLEINTFSFRSNNCANNSFFSD